MSFRARRGSSFLCTHHHAGGKRTNADLMRRIYRGRNVCINRAGFIPVMKFSMTMRLLSLMALSNVFVRWQICRLTSSSAQSTAQ